MAASAIGRSVLKSQSSSSLIKSSSQILKPSPYLSHSLRPFSANSESNSDDVRPPPSNYDYNHWEVYMERPGGFGATEQQKIDCYVQTLATVLGSEEEAKKKIYKICLYNTVFGCEIDHETSTKLTGLPGVTGVELDDVTKKDKHAKLLVNGEIVQSSPKTQLKREPIALRAKDVPTDNEPDSLCTPGP